jgi:hypothetical protein
VGKEYFEINKSGLSATVLFSAPVQVFRYNIVNRRQGLQPLAGCPHFHCNLAPSGQMK